MQVMESPDPQPGTSGGMYRDLTDKVQGFDPIRTAVVHPVDRNALLGTVEAARHGLIVPILLGPAEKIQAAAQAEEVDISGYVLIPTEHSHEAADKATEMARTGQV